jgi:hypothetical protein
LNRDQQDCQLHHGGALAIGTKLGIYGRGVQILIVTAICSRGAPTTIMTTVLPGIDGQVIILEVIVLATDLVVFAFRAGTACHNVFHGKVLQ